MKTVEHSYYSYLWRSIPFHPSTNLSLSLSIFTHRYGHLIDTVCPHSIEIFQASSLQLLKLENLLRRSLFTFICLDSVSMFNWIGLGSSLLITTTWDIFPSSTEFRKFEVYPVDPPLWYSNCTYKAFSK